MAREKGICCGKRKHVENYNESGKPGKKSRASGAKKKRKRKRKISLFKFFDRSQGELFSRRLFYLYFFYFGIAPPPPRAAIKVSTTSLSPLKHQTAFYAPLTRIVGFFRTFHLPLPMIPVLPFAAVHRPSFFTTLRSIPKLWPTKYGQ